MKKVFEFRSEETDWIAASSKTEAICFYAELTGITRKEIREMYSIRELPDNELDENKVVDTEADELPNGSYPVLGTFRKVAGECLEPEIIATTAYS